MRVFAVFESRAVLRKSQGAGFAENFDEVRGAESRKQRQVGDQRTVDCGHVASVASAISSESRLRLWLSIKRKFALAQQRRALFPLNDPENRPSGAALKWRTKCAK